LLHDVLGVRLVAQALSRDADVLGAMGKDGVQE
jgi:hypothetical protein